MKQDSPEEYYQSTLRFIDVKIDNNLAFQKRSRPLRCLHPNTVTVIYNTDQRVQGANDYKYTGFAGST
jgi:hypothetical protein